MDIPLLVLVATLFLAFANGANDNFKGVATLYGARVLSQRVSIAWASVTTLAGSLAAAWLAGELIRLFSGKGLVPEALIADPHFTLAVALGAAATVMLAARAGMPISTTHALVGALTGAGIAATSWQVQWGALFHGFFWPLVASPVIAVTAAAALYRIVNTARKRLGIGKQTCACLHNGEVVAAADGIAALRVAMPELIVGDVAYCREIERYQGRIAGVGVQRLVEAAHVVSSGAVSFARGLNDTPKIVGVALVASAYDMVWLTFVAAAAIAVGGIVASHRIAATMSDRITEIQHGRGLVANVVTSLLVIVASRWGVPVSTTHVSCGAIFGIGAASRDGFAATDWGVVRGIVSAWVLTLPLAAVAAALVYFIAG